MNIFHRLGGLHKKQYQLHPFGPVSWAFNSFLAAIYVAQAGNFWLVGLNIFMGMLSSIMAMWSLGNMRKIPAKKWHIQCIDFICLAVAIVSGAMFYLTKNALFATLILFLGNIFGEIPQLRKDWLAPRTDSIKIYLVPALRSFVSIGTLTTIDAVGLIMTLGWGIFILLEAGYLWLLQNKTKISRDTSYRFSFDRVKIIDRETNHKLK